MDNVNFKIGEDYLLRILLYKDLAKLIKNEIECLNILLQELSIQVSKPIDIIELGNLLRYKSQYIFIIEEIQL